MPPPGTMSNDDVFKPTTSFKVEGDGASSEHVPKALKNSLVIMISGLYGIALIVVGLVLPIAETYAGQNHPYMFEIFYLYLYAVSMLFLVYVYTYLLRKEQINLMAFPRSISRTFSRSFSTKSNSSQSSKRKISDRSGQSPIVRSPSVDKSMSGGGGGGAEGVSLRNSSRPLTRTNSTWSTASGRWKKRKIAFNPEASHHTGSFYLRCGVIGFGIGSMIHSGLIFGHYFEINHLGDPCSDILQAIKPFVHLIFTFVQMYFVFMNSKMCVHKYKTLARFGLMHMSGTNICVWLRSIVVETLHVIKVEERKAYDAAYKAYTQENAHGIGGNNTGHAKAAEKYDDDILGSLPEISCHWNAMMGKVVEKSSVYLYPCTIEYSLVCACVLYVMWSNVGEGATAQKQQPLRMDSNNTTDDELSDDDDDEDEKHHQKMSVDCAGSSEGLFLGIFLFVVAVVCLVCFYVLIGTEKHVTTGTLLGHISENVIYTLALFATLIAAYQMRKMHFSINREAGMEEILTLISLSGLGLFGMFSIVAAIFYIDKLDGMVTIMTNMTMMIQAGSQATFTLAALRASAVDRKQVREKPGRQYVTFLLISNFALWTINTFETQRLEHNPLQVEFYGTTAWSIFSHISNPLGIYFRFHSTVSLSNVWKKAWKLKHVQGNPSGSTSSQ